MASSVRLRPEYDVVIVGGRPAGASLALRLGRRGARVLLVDRAGIASEPQVPSSPIVYPGALKQLDELGIPEDSYAAFCPAFSSFVVQVGEHFVARSRLVDAFGRDYGRAIDRTRFDAMLWERAAACDSVTAVERFAFTDVMRDGRDRVSGIRGRLPSGEAVEVRARWVVGADGRFSTVAHKVGARVLEDSPWTSTAYLADWEGVRPFDGESEPIAHVYVTGRGMDVLILPRPEGRVVVCTHQRSDRADVRGDAEGYYHEVLSRYAPIARRLAGAQRASGVVGMKRIGNRYREAGGPGWMLVGDALHHKDPVDGQGIYDALVEARCLDATLAAMLDGRMSESEGPVRYDRDARAATHSMFEATVGRLKRELYSEPPEWAIKTAMRWMLTDPGYQRQFALFLSRAIEPGDWYKPSMLLGAMSRGLVRDLQSRFGR